jgi:hypothetical protein
MTNKMGLTVILILLRLHPSIGAATLTEETKAAWDTYLKEANASMQARLQPGAHFLWLDDEPGRAEGIRTKGPYIAPVGPHIRVDDRHWYGVSNTIHIQEVDKFGTPGQRNLPEDQGTGLIWRLSSITRLEERDGGVYAELEAIALSRDIPAAFRVFVTPIVRRVSTDSLATSLHQTKVAIDNSMAHHKLERADP